MRLALVALLCQGHLLIEDVPGTGKTVLAKAIAQSLGCTFRRIQFTPDLLPTDVTGLSIYNQKTQEFEFRPGPDLGPDRARRRDQPGDAQDAVGAARVHGRAPGDGRRRDLPDARSPFLVIATQNPIEYEGTFALPEAQLDRFMLRLHLGYPEPLEEIVILDEQKRTHPIDELEEVVARRGAARDAGRRARDLRRLRSSATTSFGWSTPRATIPTSTWARRRAARWRCIARARHTPRSPAATTSSPTTSRPLAVPALAHRTIVKTAATVRDVDAALIIRELLDTVPVESTDQTAGASSRPAELSATTMVRRIELAVVAMHRRRSRRCRPAPSSCSSWSTWASSSSAARTS